MPGALKIFGSKQHSYAGVRTVSNARNVQQQLYRANMRALKDGGAYVRKVARNSMKRAPSGHARSPVGKPPLVHLGHLKNRLVFAIDKSRLSVVIGPLVRRGSNAPRALEHGGISYSYAKTKRQGRKRQMVRIRRRPFMKPALDKSLKVVTGYWKDVLRVGR